MCFVKTSVQTSPRQHSRHSLVGLDFATIIVEHGKACPHRRVGCCIHCNPIVLSLTNKASNNLITAMDAISTERSRLCALDVPDLPDFQSLFSCHRSPYLPQVVLPDLPFLWVLHASAPAEIVSGRWPEPYRSSFVAYLCSPSMYSIYGA